jgi:hypothetical protein
MMADAQRANDIGSEEERSQPDHFYEAGLS